MKRVPEKENTCLTGKVPLLLCTCSSVCIGIPAADLTSTFDSIEDSSTQQDAISAREIAFTDFSKHLTLFWLYQKSTVITSHCFRALLKALYHNEVLDLLQGSIDPK